MPYDVSFKANREWAKRPSDQRFTSLPEMLRMMRDIRVNSTAKVVNHRDIQAIPDDDNIGLSIEVAGRSLRPTNWSFGQIAARANAPASYLSRLPAPIAADCLNYGLKFVSPVEETAVLMYDGATPTCRAATGPTYGRIWNSDIVEGLINRFGDGVTGQFRVPGEFGKQVEVNKRNTTLYASDRDMFVFLADEEHRVEVPNRRNGEPGQLARGFFVWNSEVGSATFGVALFLFDYVCANRIVWGMHEYKQITIRHTARAPQRMIEEVAPALERYAQSSTRGVVAAIEDARSKKLDNVDEFLRKRFGPRVVDAVKATHMIEEGRPIETVWDAVTGITAYARGIEHQDARVEIERTAGELLKA